MSIPVELHVPDQPGVVQVTFAGGGNPVLEAPCESLQDVRLEHVFTVLNGEPCVATASYLDILGHLQDMAGLRSMSVGDLVSLWNRDCDVCYAIYRCESTGWYSVLIEPVELPLTHVHVA